MRQLFDIFVVEEDGRFLWLGPAISLQAAKTRVEELSTDTRTHFVVLNQETGKRFYFPEETNADGIPKERSASAS
jgi:hypothetical protein